MNYQYYSVEYPNTNELVLVEFTDRNDSFFEAKILEFNNLRGMMNYQDATKKRKVSSWNKLIPLNKKMVARVEEVDKSANIVMVSLAYLPDMFQEDLSNDQIQEKLMVPFIENKQLETLMKSFCKLNDYQIEDIWTNLIHYVDDLRREYNEENEENLSIWKYFNDNISELDNWVEECGYDEEFSKKLKALYDKKTEVNNQKYTTKVGIISLGGVEQTKQMLKSILSNIDYKYQLRYDSTPYYLFETTSEDSSPEDHNNFIQLLQNESKKFEPKIFIKSETIAKIS